MREYIVTISTNSLSDITTLPMSQMTSGIPQGEYILLGPEADPGFLEGGSNSEMLKLRPFRSFTI